MPALKANVVTERSLYGLIVTATLLISLENHEHSSWDMAATILLTLLSIVIAERYASLFAKGFDDTGKSGAHEFIDLVKDYGYVLIGGVPSVLLFVLSAFGYLTIFTAFNVAELFIGLLLIIYGYSYGRKSGHSKPIALLYGMANFSIVLAIVIFKSLYHV